MKQMNCTFASILVLKQNIKMKYNFDEILYPPIDVFGKMKICFVRKENIIFELTEFLN